MFDYSEHNLRPVLCCTKRCPSIAEVFIMDWAQKRIKVANFMTRIAFRLRSVDGTPRSWKVCNMFVLWIIGTLNRTTSILSDMRCWNRQRWPFWFTSCGDCYNILNMLRDVQRDIVELRTPCPKHHYGKCIIGQAKKPAEGCDDRRRHSSWDDNSGPAFHAKDGGRSRSNQTRTSQGGGGVSFVLDCLWQRLSTWRRNAARLASNSLPLSQKAKAIFESRARRKKSQKNAGVTKYSQTNLSRISVLP